MSDKPLPTRRGILVSAKYTNPQPEPDSDAVTAPSASRNRIYGVILFAMLGIILCVLVGIAELAARYQGQQDIDTRIAAQEKLVSTNATYNLTLMEGFAGHEDEVMDHLVTRNEIPQTYRPYLETGRLPFKSPIININSLGHRGPEFDIVKGENVFRILVYGGSFVWGTGALRDNQTVSGHLQEMLNAQPGNSVRYEVFNCGQSSYNSTQGAIYLLIEGIYLSPDLVIFIDGVNDAGLGHTNLPAGYPFLFDQINALMTGKSDDALKPLDEVFTLEGELDYLKKRRSLVWQWGRSELAKRFMQLAGNVKDSARKFQQSEYTTVEEIAIRHFNNVRSARALGREYGFEVIAGVQPVPVHFKPLHPQEQDCITVFRQRFFDRLNWWDQNYLQYANLVAEMCEEVEIPFVDLVRVYENNSDQLYIDDCHVNSNGYQAVAQSLYEFASSKSLLPDARK